MQLDHLAVVCADLTGGVDYVQQSLGVALQPGGQHARYGTHNWLLSLGPGEYLEVIAPDPAAPVPEFPRWFGLDRTTAPRLGNWIARVPDLGTARAATSQDIGEIVDLRRGDLQWRIAVPPDGSLPLNGAFPTLIEWQGTAPHPSARLTDRQVRLVRLDISHPAASTLVDIIGKPMADPRIRFHPGPLGLQATFSTPSGERHLS